MYVIMDGEKIEAMREQRGLSRQEFAAEAGIAASTVAKVEEGAPAVRLKTARGIGAALGVDPRSLRHRKSERGGA